MDKEVNYTVASCTTSKMTQPTCGEHANNPMLHAQYTVIDAQVNVKTTKYLLNKPSGWKCSEGSSELTIHGNHTAIKEALGIY